jgi:hypothetical protein
MTTPSQDLARMIINEMTDDDRRDYTREAWAIGVQNQIDYSDAPYCDVTAADVLDHLDAMIGATR